MDDLRIYVISLAKENPRRSQLAEAFAPLCQSYEVVDAVDGRGGLDPKWEHELDRIETNRRTRKQVSNAEFACALSHRMTQERFLNSNGEWALILEDDMILDARISGFLAECSYRTAPMLLLHHSNARVLGKGTHLPGTKSRMVPLALSPFGTTAYTVNRPIAQCLVTAQKPVRYLGDWPIDLASVGAKAVVPAIVDHPHRDATLSTLAPNRSKPVRSLSIFLSFSYLKRKWKKLRARKVS